MMKQSMKRMILTAAAVAAVMSFAAPAMALPKVVDGDPGVVGPVDPPDKDPKFPICDVTPFGGGNTPDPVADPGENPVADPPVTEDPRNEESDTSGSGGSSGAAPAVAPATAPQALLAKPSIAEKPS